MLADPKEAEFQERFGRQRALSDGVTTELGKCDVLSMLTPANLRQRIPILDWGARYDRSSLSGDVAAHSPMHHLPFAQDIDWLGAKKLRCQGGPFNSDGVSYRNRA